MVVSLIDFHFIHSIFKVFERWRLQIYYLFIRVYEETKIEIKLCSNIFKDPRSPVYGFLPASIGPCLAPVQLFDLCLVCEKAGARSSTLCVFFLEAIDGGLFSWNQIIHAQTMA